MKIKLDFVYHGTGKHICCNIPKQMTPSPVYPSLQVQVLSPGTVSVQSANIEQPPLAVAHRFVSVQDIPKQEYYVFTYWCISIW